MRINRRSRLFIGVFVFSRINKGPLVYWSFSFFRGLTEGPACLLEFLFFLRVNRRSRLFIGVLFFRGLKEGPACLSSFCFFAG